MTEQNKTTKDQTLENLKNIIDELPKRVIDDILRKHDEPLEHRPYGLRRKILFDKISTNGGNGYISLLDLDDEINNLIELQEKSQKIKKVENIVTDNELIKSVFSIILDNLEEPTDQHLERYVYEIMEYGCKSGIVPQLIYTDDVKDFAKKHLDEIVYIINECNEIVNPLDINQIGWLGFELTLKNSWYILDDLQPMTE